MLNEIRYMFEAYSTSPSWQHVVQLALVSNMRLDPMDQDVVEYQRILDRVGGNHAVGTVVDNGLVTVPRSLYAATTTLDALINFVFPVLSADVAYQGHAILCSTNAGSE